MTVQRIALWSAAAFALILFVPPPVFAHCDSLDGPVVRAARKALATRNPNEVLIWVRGEDEPEIRAAFEQTLHVRALGPQAMELADRYFFETLVRVHRAGEGAPYTGLKPAGRDLGPAIPAADKSLEERAIDPLVILLTSAMDEGVLTHYAHAMATRQFKMDDLTAGREHVEAYVQFIHYVERLYEAITAPAGGHFDEPER
jgi:hypothetical protein